MGSLVSQAQTAYNDWKAANWPTDVSEWSALTTEQKMALWGSEQMYLLAISDAQAIEESFYAARAEAFAAFESTKLSELAALQNTWQLKEESGFDVDA